MCCFSASKRRAAFTLVELVITLIIMGIITAMTPLLFWHGARAFVFLPRQLAVNHAATEILHQAVEGGVSHLSGAGVIHGLRWASPSGGQPSIWLAEPSRLGYITAAGQSVVLRYDGTALRRSLQAANCNPPAGTEEVLALETAATVQIAGAGAFFRYYNQAGTELFPPCQVGGTSAVRRIDVRFLARTGTGNFDEGHAQETRMTSVAIRSP